MTRLFQMMLVLAVGLARAHAGAGQQPPASKVAIEFRWLEDFYIQDVPSGWMT